MALGRKPGSRNFSVRPFTQSRLQGVLFNMEGALYKGAARSLEEMAPGFLAYIVQTEPEFNDFTGNLANAYVATLYVRRKYVKTFFHDTGRHGTVHRGPKGGRWVSLLPPARHGVAGYEELQTQEGGTPITDPISGRVIGYKNTTTRKYRAWSRNARKARGRRYLKKWENPNGYRKRTGLRGGSFSAANFGSAKAQNFLRISNQAPYAEMVQQAKGATHKHYRVLRGAAVSKLTSQATELVKTVTLQELKKAGFKVR